jgi:hypothetical protein
MPQAISPGAYFIQHADMAGGSDFIWLAKNVAIKRYNIALRAVLTTRREITWHA